MYLGNIFVKLVLVLRVVTFTLIQFVEVVWFY